MPTDLAGLLKITLLIPNSRILYIFHYKFPPQKHTYHKKNKIIQRSLIVPPFYKDKKKSLKSDRKTLKAPVQNTSPNIKPKLYNLTGKALFCTSYWETRWIYNLTVNPLQPYSLLGIRSNVVRALGFNLSFLQSLLIIYTRRLVYQLVM